MSYDAIAEWYDQTVRNGLPAHALTIPMMIELAGDLEGKLVCDLCCGQGIMARELARHEAKVTGIDLSNRLLEVARRDEEADPLGVIYRYGDAQHLPAIEDACFDGVTCVMALMDIPNLQAVLRTIARVLRPSGWFIFAITHPCFQTPDSRWTGKAGGVVKREVRGYFREGFWRSDNPNGVRGQIGAYHRMLSTYVDALNDAGFIIERMREPQALDEISGRVPGYSEVPAVLIVRCRRRMEGESEGPVLASIRPEQSG